MDAKKLAVGAAAAAMLALGGGAALAAQNPAEATGALGAKQEEKDPNIRGTVAAPAEQGGEDEAAETKRLEGLAKVDRGREGRPGRRARHPQGR